MPSFFCNTRAMVSRLTARLSNRGFSVVALSGELTQSERSNALQAMRDGRARVCVGNRCCGPRHRICPTLIWWSMPNCPTAMKHCCTVLAVQAALGARVSVH